MTNLLNPNESLGAGNSLVSQDGRFTFTMQRDGNLVLYMAGAATWASDTVGSNATQVVMQGDGNLVIYDANDNAVWASMTDGNPGAYLEIQNDGNAVIYAPNGNALWSTDTSMASRLHRNQRLAAGDSIISQDSRFMLIMQGDGNLVLYMAGTATWASNTMGSNATRVIMQDDGNLVIYDVNGAPVWASNTPGNPGAYLEIQNDGNAVIYAPNGNALWATNTSFVTASRMRIRVESIMCYDPEDILDGDEFYMAGLSLIDDGSPNPKSQGIIVSPIEMRSGYTRFPSPTEANVFDDAVTPDSIVRLVLRAFDEDVAKDWESRPQWIDTITQSSATTIAAAVAVGIGAATWPVVIGGAIALGLLAGIYFGIKYDKDDELGNLYLAVPAAGLSNEGHIWQFSRQDWKGYSSWNYTVRLRIERM